MKFLMRPKPFQPLQLDVPDCVSQEGSDMKRNPASIKKKKKLSCIFTCVKRNGGRCGGGEKKTHFDFLCRSATLKMSACVFAKGLKQHMETAVEINF